MSADARTRGRLARKVLPVARAVNRRLGNVPKSAYWALRHAGREWPRRSHPLAATDSDPLFSVVIPVHDHAEFLARAVDSVLGQSFRDLECVIVDDASTDERVRPILDSFRADPRTRILLGRENLGISGATNHAVAAARGRYLAFLDGDDELAPQALSRVRTHLAKHPESDFVYTNRVDIDAAGRAIEHWDVTERTFSNPAQELLLGMFTSHLKVIRRDAFRRVGLFRAEFDGAQDYDLALRLSESGRLSFLRETLYRHRIHPRQASQRALERQNQTAAMARERALLRRRLAAGGYDGVVSIVVRRAHRAEPAGPCVDAVGRHTPFRHEIVVVDSDAARDDAVRIARGEYVVLLDSGLLVDPGWLAHLLTEMEWDRRLAACSCRVLFADGTVHFNGARASCRDGRVCFELRDHGRPSDDLGTLIEHACDWVPARATIFRKTVLERWPWDTELHGCYDAEDWSLRVRQDGWTLATCPLATARYRDGATPGGPGRGDDDARDQGGARRKEALRHFHRKHGLLIDDGAPCR